ETASTCCDDTGCSSGQSCSAHACVSASSSSSSSSSSSGGGGGSATTTQNRTNQSSAAQNATNASAQNATNASAQNATANQTVPSNGTNASSGLGTPAGQFYNPPQEQPPLWALTPLAALLIALALFAFRGRILSKKSGLRKRRP
ncbi:MAG TPA: hypothetical protein VJB16_01275, partial [archaeon]|nr:hypothetical protein [archaeon]